MSTETDQAFAVEMYSDFDCFELSNTLVVAAGLRTSSRDGSSGDCRIANQIVVQRNARIVLWERVHSTKVN